MVCNFLTALITSKSDKHQCYMRKIIYLIFNKFFDWKLNILIILYINIKGKPGKV